MNTLLNRIWGIFFFYLELIIRNTELGKFTYILTFNFNVFQFLKVIKLIFTEVNYDILLK